MSNRSRYLGSVHCVRCKVVVGVLLLSVIPYGLVRPGKSDLAAAGTRANKEVLSTSAPLQTVGQIAENEVNDNNSKQDSSWKTVRMRVTGYCPCRRCCGKYSDGITASGHRIEGGDGFVAADKKHSFGARVIVPGYNNSKPVRVLDRGGAIRGNRLDVFFNSHREAQEWGIRYLPVKVQTR